MNVYRRFRIGVNEKRSRSSRIKGMPAAEYHKRRYHNPSLYRECYMCGRNKPVRMRFGKNEAVCPNCYQKYFYTPPVSTCSKCGHIKPVAKYTDDGKPICRNCYHKKMGFCAKCGKEKIIQALGLCYGCYQKHRRHLMAKSA